MNVRVLHGPNLTLLGEREPHLYGRTTRAELDARIAGRAAELGITVRCYQSNHEGSLIDFLQAERKWAQGLVINAGALTHYSWALADAVAATGLPCIEVHISDVSKREAWRQFSVFEQVRKDSYLQGLELLVSGR